MTAAASVRYGRMVAGMEGIQMSENPTTLRGQLGRELKALRERGGGPSLAAVSQAFAARDIDFSASKLNRLENGLNTVKLQDIQLLLDHYGVDDTERDAIMQLAGQARAAKPSAWWAEFESVLPSGMSTYVGLEAAAKRVRAFTLTLIDGRLQTEEYARSLIRQGRPDDSSDVIERLVQLRLERQQVLTTRKPPLELITIMDESVLHRPSAPPELMRDQLRHMHDVASSLKNVTVLVAPYAAGVYSALRGSFTLIDPQAPDENPVGYVDSMGGNLYMKRPTQIQDLETRFDRLRQIALDERQSLQVIQSAAREM